MDPRSRSDFRVIAEGNNAVGHHLTLGQALALVDVARGRGNRFVAIVDDSTGAIVDERRLRARILRGPPPLPQDRLAPCPACKDEGGSPSGDVLVQLLSGTWVRQMCDVCEGRKTVPPEELARRSAQVAHEPSAASAMAPSGGPRIASGTRRRVPRVLVVDDDPVLSGVLRLALSSELEVKSASSAQEAQASMLSGDWYDVVLCQLQMPEMNGDELRDRVHTARPELAARFVFVGDRRVDVRALCELVRRLVFPVASSVGAAGTPRQLG